MMNTKHLLILFSFIASSLQLFSQALPTGVPQLMRYPWYRFGGYAQTDSGLIVRGTEVNPTAKGSVAQLRTITGRFDNYIVTEKGRKGTFIVDTSDHTSADNGGTILVTTDGKRLKRVFDGPINATWFGILPDDTLNDTQPFKNLLQYTSTLDYKPEINIPAGRYVLKEKLVISGGISGSMPMIKGDGARNTILDFSTALGNTAIQFGNPETGSSGRDALHGGLEGLRIIGNSNMDGLVIASSAPTSGAFNTFRDLFFTTVRDGVNQVSNENTSSNYVNFFYNINVQGYYRNAFHLSGVYNYCEGLFLVSPQGSGANTLGLWIDGGANTIINAQTEDQNYINGRGNHIQHLDMEYILKSVENSVIGKTAIRISNTDNHIDGLKMTGFKNTIIDFFGTIAGGNHSIKNAVYYDEGNPLYAITYPFFPSAESSGVMENISVQSGILLDNAALDGYLTNWTLINVTGLVKNPFSKIRNLDYKETNPGALRLDGSGDRSILGITRVDTFEVKKSSVFQGFFVIDANIRHVNKARTDFRTFIDYDSSGSEIVRNFYDVGNINAKSANFISYVTGIKPVNPNHLTTKAYTDSLYATVGGGVAGVASFNSRTGAVVPASGDYSSYYAALSHTHPSTDITGQKGDVGVVIVSPTATEDLTLTSKTTALTVDAAEVVIRGTSPSVTWNVYWSSTRTGTPTKLFTSNRTTTATESVISFNNTAIPSGSYVWFVTSAVSGTIDEFSLQLKYTK